MSTTRDNQVLALKRREWGKDILCPRASRISEEVQNEKEGKISRSGFIKRWKPEPFTMSIVQEVPVLRNNGNVGYQEWVCVNSSKGGPINSASWDNLSCRVFSPFWYLENFGYWVIYVPHYPIEFIIRISLYHFCHPTTDYSIGNSHQFHSFPQELGVLSPIS